MIFFVVLLVECKKNRKFVDNSVSTILNSMNISPKYPIGVETFSIMIEGGFAYVDKTKVIYRLTQAGQYFFLSRPRRFGKSLMLSTLEAYFEGRRELFEGLWLGKAEGVDWTPHPVLRLNFISSKTENEELKALISRHLKNWEKQYEITDIENSLSQRFFNVVKKAYDTTGQRVVILIDEYDKVLVNTLHNPELHEEMKSILKPVFSVLKEADRYIRFAMLTGVSRFSKLSIFSDINNLRDITLSDEFCTICGITEEEMINGFSQGIQDIADARKVSFDQMAQELKDNYDGYHFSAHCPDIYNPYSLINAFAERRILHKWFESGTPTFLLERIRNSDEDLRAVLSQEVSDYTLSNTSISDTNLVNILYQTGYLTIKSYDEQEDSFLLGIPNREVEFGMYSGLLPLITPYHSQSTDARW